MSRTLPARAGLAATKAACVSAVQRTVAVGFGFPFSWSVSGLRMRAVAGTNRGKN